MPMDYARYPADWHAIARKIKDACDWQCQECGQQCRGGDANKKGEGE